VSYRTKVLESAQQEIRALPGYVRAQAYRLLDQLQQNPRPPRAKELRDKPGIYRLWLAGRWRIVYHIDEDLKQVYILRVRRKERVDYENL
jgi:mRNA-degrading endonuclease RelE of RelBE toxin-antitoxin system